MDGLSVAHGERLSVHGLTSVSPRGLTRDFSISGSPVERGFELLLGAIAVGILRAPHRNTIPCCALDTEMTAVFELPNDLPCTRLLLPV